ncbi:hypothetical protein NKG94_35440 [Micromonospora sp. M12]
MLAFENGEPLHLVRAAKLRLRDLGEFGEVRQVRLPRQVDSPPRRAGTRRTP